MLLDADVSNLDLQPSPLEHSKSIQLFSFLFSQNCEGIKMSDEVVGQSDDFTLILVCLVII